MKTRHRHESDEVDGLTISGLGGSAKATSGSFLFFSIFSEENPLYICYVTLLDFVLSMFCMISVFFCFSMEDRLMSEKNCKVSKKERMREKKAEL